MKVKKIILTMVSTLILLAIAFSQVAYASTPIAEDDLPIQFVKLVPSNYNKEGEYHYYIGNPNEAIIDSNVMILTRFAPKIVGADIVGNRIYDAYCVRATKGFDEVVDTGNGQILARGLFADETKYIDTYNKRFNMVTERGQIDNHIIEKMDTDVGEGVTVYDAILQMTNLFFLEGDNFDSYTATTLKNVVNSKISALGYTSAYDYLKFLENDGDINVFLTEDQVRAVQQAALWYFTNCDNESFNWVGRESANWMYVKESDSDVAKTLNMAFRDNEDNSLISEEAQALYEYLISTAITNAKNNVAIDNNVYLYTNLGDKTNTQPIIIIERNRKEFDLALRKYISRVYKDSDHIDPANPLISCEEQDDKIRRPSVETSNLNINGITTAEYKHKKDPVVVEKGNVIDYKLVIYNEGEIAGRATKIIDRLPAGVSLISSGEVTSEIKGNVYEISTNANNEVILQMKDTSNTDIAPASLDGNNNTVLDRDVIVIQCEVTADPDEDNEKIYTNIAWIAEDYNYKGIPDRDSNLNGNNTPNIPANLVTTDKGYTNGDNHDLTDSDHYFEGQEDDDDFEKIKIKSVKGSYNIVLVKEDKDGEQLNETATFEVDGVTKTVTGRLTIVSNKQINESNVNEVDTYIIKETVPPDAYCAFDGTIKIEVYKKKDGDKYVVDSIKYYVDNVEVTENRTDLKVYLNTDGNIYVEVKDYQFDLALRKFITKIETKASNYTEYTLYNEDGNRIPYITGESINIKNGSFIEDTTAEKEHTKDKLQVAKGDKVTYTIRIYNEGQIDGYAAEVTDYLPAGLTLSPSTEGDGSINDTYGWGPGEKDEITGITEIKSTYLKDNNIVIPAANDTWENLNELDDDDNPIYYRDLLVECYVNDDATQDNLKNIAAITKYEDENGREVPDRDSDKGPITPDTYNPKGPTKGIGEQDDDDFEDLKLEEIDLALRKFITRVGAVLPMTDDNSTEYSRQPYDSASNKEVSPSDITKLYNGEITTAEYKHQKNPVKVNVGDYVEYTLRVYNEGSMDGYAKEITDHLPPYLKLAQCDENTAYGWVADETNPRIVKTTYLSNTKLSAVTATTLDSSAKHNKELKIICQVVDNTPTEEVQTNIAEISLYGDKSGNDLKVDRDSQTEGTGKAVIPEDNDLPDYKGNSTNKEDLEDRNYHYKGQQDDDDFEKIYVPKFDLALRKFITKVETENGKDRYSEADYAARVPQISQESYEELINGGTTTLKYTHSKDPMNTVKTDVVTYTLRVYNEGNVAGYAEVVTDDIPEGVEFLPENATNKEYRWKMFAELPEGATAEAGREMVELNINGSSEVKKYVETEDVSKAKIIRTDYLSKEQGEERMEAGSTANPNLIKALDLEAGLSDTNPDYRDIKVAFKVVEPNGSDRIIINYAQISEDLDEEGRPVTDIDSTPNRWNEGEDDQDIEKIKVPQFDLALRKWVTQAIVTENGQTTVTETGHDAWDDPEEIVKVELHRKKLSTVTVKFRYSIRVYNQGEIDGYVKEITDYIPQGLKFVAEDNPDWIDEGNNVISTKKLEGTLLKPGDYADVEVLLTWINGNDNLGLKVNTAEISEDYNDWGVPDKDSTPDNRVPGEDDIDDAPVMLSVSTGMEVTYIVLGLTVLITIAGGVALIKKYVM